MIRIFGTMTDPSGSPVPGAIIELRAISSTSEVLLGSTITQKCDQQGSYSFQLATGTYDAYAQNDQCGDMDYMGTGVVTAQSTDGPLNSILVDNGINLTPPLLERAVEAMQRSEAAAKSTADDRQQTDSDVTAAEQARQISTEQAAEASSSAAMAGRKADDAVTSAGAAAGSAISAQKWAENPVDVAVAPGKHSALHHATKANDSALESTANAAAAAASASTASAQAANANTSANMATTKASEAATSASEAANQASAASNAKVAAATFATNAGTHASNAENAVQAAEGAKVMTLDNAAKVGTLAEQVTADRVQVQEKANLVAANAETVAGQVQEVSTNTDAVSQANTAVQGMRDVVVAKTTQAQAAADTASGKASQAAQDQALANASAQRASVSEGMAEAWAQNPEGSDINGRPGEFSALHWALQAQKWAKAISSQLVWAGPWNAVAGAPIVPAANQGVPFYRISHPGEIAGVSYVAGDYLHWDPNTRTWFKIDGSDAVISVNGMTGAVVLSAADVGARPASWVPGWTDITNKPVTMSPSEHSHPWSQLSNVPVYASRWPTLVEVGAAAASHTHHWSQLTGLPAYVTRWPAWGEVTDKPDLAAASHRHPWNQIDQIPVTASRWPTWTEVTDKPSLAAATHRHPWGELDDVPATASRWPSYNEVTDKPTLGEMGGYPKTGGPLDGGIDAKDPIYARVGLIARSRGGSNGGTWLGMEAPEDADPYISAKVNAENAPSKVITIGRNELTAHKRLAASAVRIADNAGLKFSPYEDFRGLAWGVGIDASNGRLGFHRYQDGVWQSQAFWLNADSGVGMNALVVSGGSESAYHQVRNAGNPSVELHEPGKFAVMMYKPQGTATLRFCSSNGAGGEAQGYGGVDGDGFFTVAGRFRAHYPAANRSWASKGQCSFWGETITVPSAGVLLGIAGTQMQRNGLWALENHYGMFNPDDNANNVEHVLSCTDGGGFWKVWRFSNAGQLTAPSGWRIAPNGDLFSPRLGGNVVDWVIGNFAGKNAASGNADIVAGGWGQVGTYMLASVIPGHAGAMNPSDTIAGSSLRPANCSEFGQNRDWALPGTWKCLGFVTNSGDDRWDDRTTLFIRIA